MNKELALMLSKEVLRIKEESNGTMTINEALESIVKSYKDLIKHTSFKADASAAPDEIAPTKIEFESFLKSFIEKEKEKNNG